MDRELEVHHVIRYSLNSCTPSSSKIVKLVENGRNISNKNVNERDENDETLLQCVIQHQHINNPAIVSFLLEKGAAVNSDVFPIWNTPLHSAAGNHHDSAV